jgi:hypothetical protein
MNLKAVDVFLYPCYRQWNSDGESGLALSGWSVVATIAFLPHGTQHWTHVNFEQTEEDAKKLLTRIKANNNIINTEHWTLADEDYRSPAQAMDDLESEWTLQAVRERAEEGW